MSVGTSGEIATGTLQHLEPHEAADQLHRLANFRLHLLGHAQGFHALHLRQSLRNGTVCATNC